MNSKFKKAAVVLTAAVIVGGAGIGAAKAQGPAGQNGTGRGLGLGGAVVCSTTNYTDVAAKALGMDAAALRLALVSGQTLQEIATSKNVTIDTVQAALMAARDADLQQAVKDGLITQEAYDQFKQQTTQNQPQANATPDAAQSGQPQRPMLAERGPRMMGISAHNEIHPLVVAAQAIGISCPDLVKAMQGGQTIAQVASSKQVQAQTVIDAIVNAEKAALAQDVKEGLITQAESDRLTGDLTNRVGAMLYNAGPGGGRGGFGGGPGLNNGFGGRGNRGNDNGGNGSNRPQRGPGGPNGANPPANGNSSDLAPDAQPPAADNVAPTGLSS